MRAVYLRGFGGPEMLDYVENAPEPEPGVGEALIKVHACGCNNTDIWTREGAYGAGKAAAWSGEGFAFPRIQGMDIVGEVAGLGPQTSGPATGTRVMVNSTLYGDRGLLNARFLGSEADGGFADYAVVPVENAHPVESALDSAELAAIGLTHLTAEHMLERAGVVNGDRVLITGASGGVGTALIQLARARGARVAALTSERRAHMVHALGAEDLLLRDGPTGWLSGAAESFDVVADVVAGDQVGGLLECLVTGGRYVIAGAVGGAVTNIDWRRVYLRHLTIFGSTMGTQKDFRAVVDMTERGTIKPILARTFPLHELELAQNFFRSKRYFGNIAIDLREGRF